MRSNTPSTALAEVFFVEAGMFGELLDDIVLVHGDGSFARFALAQPTLGPDGPRSNPKTQDFREKTREKGPGSPSTRGSRQSLTPQSVRDHRVAFA
jgi:hypothetical protein